MEIQFHNFSLVLDPPLATASDTLDVREGTLVRVAADGVVGVGESTPLHGWTEPIEQCVESLSGAASLVRDGMAPEEALGALTDSRAARHGFQTALADHAAKTADEPLYRHLGAEETVESVPVNATVGDGTARETAREAEAAVDEGFDCLKVKVANRHVHEDVERLQSVRDVAPDATLRVDANGGWSRHQAETAIPELDALDVAYVEQPLAADELDGHATLRESVADTDVGIALDESLSHLPVDLVLERGAADVLVLKPAVFGGLDETRDVALRAREAGVTPVVSTLYDAVVGRTAAVHLAASLGDVPACGLATADRLAEDLGADPAPVADGEMTVPQTPGVGTMGPWDE